MCVAARAFAADWREDQEAASEVARDRQPREPVRLKLQGDDMTIAGTKTRAVVYATAPFSRHVR